MTPGLFFAVAAVGAVGAVARYLSDVAIKSFASPRFPWATFTINVVGSFILGVVTGAVAFSGAPSDLRTIIGIGFCGGYTTFSTAMFEAVTLLREERWRAAVGTIAGTLVATTAAAAVGLVLGAA